MDRAPTITGPVMLGDSTARLRETWPLSATRAARGRGRVRAQSPELPGDLLYEPVSFRSRGVGPWVMNASAASTGDRCQDVNPLAERHSGQLAAPELGIPCDADPPVQFAGTDSQKSSPPRLTFTPIGLQIISYLSRQ